MARTKLMAFILSTALLMTGAVFNNVVNFVEHSPTLLYLAGQFKMITGDTNAALDLIGRAANAGRSQQAPAATKPVNTEKPAAPTVCKQQQMARQKATKVAVAKVDPRSFAEAAVPMTAPQVLLSGYSPEKFKFPVVRMRELANERAIQKRVAEQQKALSRLEHMRLQSYFIVMQTAPRVHMDLPDPAAATP